jgi:large subunit ribosomal protein L19e
MDAGSQKRIAAGLMKCGVSRVRIKQTEEVEEALTREDIRGLIQKGVIWSVQKKGTSKFASKKRLVQKKKGRMRGPGRRKGTKGARKNDKTKWIEKVRPLRKLLADLRENGQISREDYGMLYRRVKGGFFRNKKHILYYMKENDILKTSKKEARPSKKASAKKVLKEVVKKVSAKNVTKKQKKAAKKSEKKPVKKAAKAKAKPAKKKVKKSK